MDPPSKPQLCCLNGQGRDGGGAGCPLFTWPGVEALKLCPSPQHSIMEGRKGAWLMTVPHRRSSSLSSVDTFASGGRQTGPSLPTLQEGFHNSVMRLLCLAA